MYKKNLFSIHVFVDKYIIGLFSINEEVAYAL